MDKKRTPYYEKTKLYNPESNEGNPLSPYNKEEEKKWDNIFEELKNSKIIDVGFHPSAQEGGFCVYYETKEGEQKAFVMGFAELGPWIEYSGLINEEKKEIKVGTKIKIIKTYYNVDDSIYKKVFIVEKIEKMDDLPDFYDEIHLIDEEGNKPMGTYGRSKGEFEITVSRNEIIPI
jgi:hypothetical protein